MKYNDTISFLYSQLPCYQKIGQKAYKANLDNTLALLDAIGNPHRKLRCIHIAGTNGKGSTSHIIASILQENGYKTGLYTSPHLLDFRERIKINGKLISKKYISTFVKKNNVIISKIKPSFFEITVAVAFEYFYIKKVDFAVIETGLGGRLDSTNVIFPILSIITNIGLDHTALLGETIEEIAKEKAGIIKPKVPIIIGETDNKTSEIFLQKANEEKSNIIFADKIYSISNSSILNWHSKFSIKKKSIEIIKNLSSPLQGLYQIKNITTVIAAIEELQKNKVHISKKSIKTGLLNTTINTGLLGRWQIISDKPFIVCDTAHNFDGISATMKHLLSLPSKDIHIILGMVNDKDISKIITLLPKAAKYYITKPNIERGMEIKTLASFFNDYTFSTHKTVNQAYKQALKQLTPSSSLYIGGSTFIVADFLQKNI